MRGDEDLQEGMFSYISTEKRVPADHPLRTDPQDGGRDPEGDVAEVRKTVLRCGAEVDSKGATVEVTAVAGFLFGAQ